MWSSKPGDLLLTIHILDDDQFTLDGMDIHSQVQISLSQAILGDKITIKTADGLLNIEVPAGTQNGSTMVLNQYGAHEFNPPELYDINHLRGNMILTFKVVIPNQYTEE